MFVRCRKWGAISWNGVSDGASSYFASVCIQA